MGLRSNSRTTTSALSLSILLLLFASVAFHSVSAQELELETDKEESTGSKDLSRRSKISLSDLEIIKDKTGLILDTEGLGIFDAFFTSLSMILVSEIGDETFIIAALMAMRHPKSIVLSGALSALVVMTVEEKLESGQGKTTFRRFFSRFCTPIFLESFVLTFLAEWGDRSQIATIALATHKDAIGVAVGAIIGHTVCTSVAVVGGSMLASKISQRTVATVGGLLFLGFSLSSYFYPPL
uniref:GDT1 family protein n=1 Tax=Fagus sylvatica TaxID=28930 RepID=A0A2N9GHB7_FAGSY